TKEGARPEGVAGLVQGQPLLHRSRAQEIVRHVAGLRRAVDQPQRARGAPPRPRPARGPHLREEVPVRRRYSAERAAQAAQARAGRYRRPERPQELS
ncbi:hypothetical protein BN1723_020667, partial [Verticillium longisporum]